VPISLFMFRGLDDLTSSDWEQCRKRESFMTGLYWVGIGTSKCLSIYRAINCSKMRTGIIYKSLESAFLRWRGSRPSRPSRNCDQFSIGLLVGYGDVATKIEYKENTGKQISRRTPLFICLAEAVTTKLFHDLAIWSQVRYTKTAGSLKSPYLFPGVVTGDH
jgi:hypothetical protein